MRANKNVGPPVVAAHSMCTSPARHDKSTPSQRAGVRKLSRSEKSVHEARCAELHSLLLLAPYGQSEQKPMRVGTWTCVFARGCGGGNKPDHRQESNARQTVVL